MQGLCHRGVSSFLCPGGNAAGLQTPVARQLNPKKEVLLEGEGKRTSKQEAFQEISLLHQHMFHPQFLQTDKCAINCPFYQKFFDSHSELIKKKLTEMRTPPRDHRQKPLYVNRPRQIDISPGDTDPALAFSSTGTVLTGQSITTQAISTTHQVTALQTTCFS